MATGVFRKDFQLYEHHQLSNLFPMMGEKELSQLTQSIRENGLISPIALYEGKILDGRNRQAACHAANIQPSFINIEPDQALNYVLAANLDRRELAPQQYALLISKLEIEYDQKIDLQNYKYGCKKRQIAYARTIVDSRNTPIFEAVMNLDVPLYIASALLNMDATFQQNYLEASASLRKAMHSYFLPKKKSHKIFLENEISQKLEDALKISKFTNAGMLLMQLLDDYINGSRQGGLNA